MKHLVLMVGAYYPQPSPTGKCAGQYASLLKEKFNIDVVYIQSNLEKIHGVTVNDETLYGLSNWRLWTETWFQELNSKATNKFLRKLSIVGVMGMKAIGRLQSMVLFPNNLRWFYKEAYKTLCSIHKENPVDVVFTVNSPFSAHLAGEAFKKICPDVRWVTYTVDPFYAGCNRGKKVLGRKYDRALSAEKRVLSHADANFLSEEAYENSKELYAKIMDKTFPLPYLLPCNDNQGDDRFDSSKINLVYAGRFYKDIRNPEYLLRTFLLTKNENIVLHLYAASDCETLIDKYVRKSAGRIIRHELVNSKEVQKVLSSADILVNVGNSLPEFKPSKTFEYIATGRPIINFYQNDLCDEVMEKYPLALQIDQNEQNIDKSVELFEEFCKENKGKCIEWEEVERLFPDNKREHIKSILLNFVL